MFQLTLRDRVCPVCQEQTPAQVHCLENYDLSQLDSFAFSSRKLPEHMHLRLHRCSACSVLYASPAPSVEQLSQLYREASYDSQQEAGFAARTYRECLEGALQGYPLSRGRALDIGTGDGAFLKELLSLGFQSVEGVEPSLAPIQSAEEGIRPLIRNQLFSPGLFEPESFDLISCFQTLEHVDRPGEIVAELFKLLRPGGLVFFVDHNESGMFNRILGKKSPIYDIEHLQLFNPKSLRALLDNAGFQKVQVKAITNRYPLSYWLRLAPLGKGLKQKLLSVLAAVGLGHSLIRVPVGNLAAFGVKPQR